MIAGDEAEPAVDHVLLQTTKELDQAILDQPKYRCQSIVNNADLFVR